MNNSLRIIIDDIKLFAISFTCNLPYLFMAKTETVSCRANVAIVDDDEDIRLSLKDILQSTGDFNFAGGFSNAAEALAGIPSLLPDLAVMDIRLPDLNGIECAKELRRRIPSLKVVMITGIHEANWVTASLQAGAVSYLFKPIIGDQLLTTLKFALITENTNLNHQKTRSFSAKCGVNLLLSPRERQVLESLADGLLYKEISDRLGLSYAAVHKYQHKIFKKLHVSNRSEAIRAWLDNRSS